VVPKDGEVDGDVGSAATAAPDIANSETVATAGASLEASGHAAPDSLAVVAPSVYIQLDEFARGGLGRIIRAKDTRTGRIVAIKEMLSSTEDAAHRFAREAMITANLQHPAIVPVYEVGRWTSGKPFYAMKLVSGRPLDQVIASTKTIDDRLALVSHVLAVADALAYAHGERVIHRDLKPHNVLVGAFGETVVIDWGLARRLDESDPSASAHRVISAVPGQTHIGAVMGTPAYMPPEQASGARVDERADVYAIGAILYHLLTGKAPYSGKTIDELLAKVKASERKKLSEIDPSIPADLAAIVERAMAPERVDRYSSAADLAADLRRFTTGQLVQAHRYTRMQRMTRFVSRNRAAVAIASAAIIAGNVGGTIAVRNIISARDVASEERGHAVKARDEARKRLVDAHVDRARVELAAGHNDLALAYSIAAADLGELDGRLRFIAGRAIAAIPPTVRLPSSSLLRSARFIPDSHDLVIGRAADVTRWNVETNRVVWKREGTYTNLLVAFDKTTFATGTPEGILWFDTETGQPAGRADPPAGKRLTGSIASDPAFRWLAISIEGGGALVHDLTTNKSEVRPLDPKSSIHLISPDGERFLVETRVTQLAARLSIVDRAGREIANLCNNCVRSAFFRDNVVIAEFDAPHYVRVFSWAGKQLAEVRPATIAAVTDLAPDDDGVHFGFVTSDGGIELHHLTRGLLWKTKVENRLDTIFVDKDRMWATGPFAGTHVFDARTGTRLAHWSEASGIDVAVSHDGAYVVSIDLLQGTTAWRASLALEPVFPTNERVRRLVFLDDGRRVTASDDGVITRYEKSGASKELGKHAARIVNLELVGADKILTASRDNTVVVRDLATGREITRIESALRGSAAPDGTIAIGTMEGAVSIWENGAARQVGKLEGEIAAVKWSPDGTLIAAIDDKGTMGVWRRDGSLVRSIPPRFELGIDVNFSPRGNWLVRTDSHSGPEELHSLVDGVPDRVLRGGTEYQHITFVYAFSPDEKEVTIAGTGLLIKWNLETGALLDLRPKADPTSVMYSNDQRFVFVGSIDGFVRVYDVASGEVVASIVAPREVYGLAKSSDDRKLAALTLGPAVVWDILPFTSTLVDLKAHAACEIDVEIIDSAVRRRTIDVNACNARREPLR
jgi:WD40 repeat protein/tRNA A-37 threonylcarbamoyl transferase component Bud32